MRIASKNGRMSMVLLPPGGGSEMNWTLSPTKRKKRTGQGVKILWKAPPVSGLSMHTQTLAAPTKSLAKAAAAARRAARVWL